MTDVNTVVEDGDEVVTTRRGKVLDKYAQKRIRTGKTRRDHESGAWKQRIANLADRAAWIHEITPKVYSSEAAVPKCPKAHGLGNSSKRFKVKAAPRSKN